MKSAWIMCGAVAATLLIGCTDDSSTATTLTTAAASTNLLSTSAESTSVVTTDSSSPSSSESTFVAEVWADNWFSLTINGVLVGEDSVPITTERSFNAETITFTASYPLTIAMVTKDYKETDSGLEYIGTDRQQMGDGGFIAQVTDTATGNVVATTSSQWRGLVIHSAPLNTDCVTSANPDVDCEFESLAEPADWTTASFADDAWPTATLYTAAEVGTKDGYDTVQWSPDASLIWTSDLKVDNTILWRFTAPG